MYKLPIMVFFPDHSDHQVLSQKPRPLDAVFLAHGHGTHSMCLGAIVEKCSLGTFGEMWGGYLNMFFASYTMHCILRDSIHLQPKIIRFKI